MIRIAKNTAIAQRIIVTTTVDSDYYLLVLKGTRSNNSIVLTKILRTERYVKLEIPENVNLPDKGEYNYYLYTAETANDTSVSGKQLLEQGIMKIYVL